MSDKASVSKELNAQHAKILLGLLKLPENKECADCKSKGPRWASINLGIFICMRCSGIHRSLGVHISKVRSTTLDIWLPDQVAFMQAMGNRKANSYWEADLPLEFYRSPIETFIYAKYVDRRWASATSPQPNPEISSISVRKEIPKKARRYSLDEEFFIKPLIAPPTSTHHSRAESLSLMDGLDDSAPPPLISFEKGLSSSSSNSSKTTNMDNSAAAAAAGGTSTGTGTGTDLFSLLYVSQETQDRTVVPPSRWATFDD